MVAAADRGTRPRLPPTTAVAVVLLVWVPYTFYFAASPSGLLGALLGLLPAAVCLPVLRLAGWPSADCFLLRAPLSAKGAVALGLATFLTLPVLASGHWSGWSTAGVLLYAPISGVSQELYFRSSLLPAVLHLVPGRPSLALAMHAVLFALWHLRMLLAMPLGVAVLAFSVIAAAGVAWGWQTMHDRTVLWAVVQHSAFLGVMALFTFT